MDRLPGATVVEFGTPWCGHCQRAQPLIEAALKDRADIAHVKVEDGPGQRLGRTFGVKLWPTLVFLKDGRKWHAWCAHRAGKSCRTRCSRCWPESPAPPNRPTHRSGMY